MYVGCERWKEEEEEEMGRRAWRRVFKGGGEGDPGERERRAEESWHHCEQR